MTYATTSAEIWSNFLALVLLLISDSIPGANKDSLYLCVMLLEGAGLGFIAKTFKEPTLRLSIGSIVRDTYLLMMYCCCSESTT
jgi:hypothetical protein